MSRNDALQQIGSKFGTITAAGALHRLSDPRVVLEPGLCDGLQLGKFVALPQYRCERGGLTHRLGDLGDQPGERFTKGHARGLPIGAADRFGDLEQAERRRFPFFDTECQFVRHDAIEI